MTPDYKKACEDAIESMDKGNDTDIPYKKVLSRFSDNA